MTASSVHAQPAGWTGVGAFDIDNQGVEVTDFEAPFTIDGAALIADGNLQVSGADLRFSLTSDGAGSLSYWIDGDIDTSAARVWVHVPTLPANGTTRVYFFVGNPLAAPQSNAPATFAAHTYSGNGSVTSTTPSTASPSQRGFRFSASDDILLMQFGKYEPNGTTRFVTLFDFTTQAIIRQVQVPGPAATYAYENTSPLWLSAGTQYVIEMFQQPGDQYFINAPPSAGPHISFHEMRYCNGCTKDTFPTNVINGSHFGFPDFRYARPPTLTPTPALTAVPVVDHDIELDDARAVVVAGEPYTYVLVAGNQGAVAAADSRITLPLPAQIASMSYTAMATGGATGFTANGTGGIDDTVTMPFGSTITYTVTLVVDEAATGTITANASVSVAAGGIDVSPKNDSRTDTNTVVPRAIFQDGFE